MKNYTRALVAVCLMVGNSKPAESTLLRIENALPLLIAMIEEQQLIIDGQEREIVHLESHIQESQREVCTLEATLAYHVARNTPAARQARLQEAADNLAALHQDLDEQIAREFQELVNLNAQQRFDQGRDGHYSDDEDL